MDLVIILWYPRCVAAVVWTKNEKCFQDAWKQSFTAKCINTFVAHCTFKKILYYSLLTYNSHNFLGIPPPPAKPWPLTIETVFTTTLQLIFSQAFTISMWLRRERGVIVIILDCSEYSAPFSRMVEMYYLYSAIVAIAVNMRGYSIFF